MLSDKDKEKIREGDYKAIGEICLVALLLYIIL
jgi:hypothetical protein